MELLINNLHWNIDWVEQDSSTLDCEGTEQVCGITYRTKCHIFINNNLPLDLMKRTIAHELTHAYIWSYGLMQFENFNEENVCDFMESFGSKIMKQTKKVLDFYKNEVMDTGE